MGMIGQILGVIFGSQRNVIRDTVEVFRPNAEAEAVRDAELAASVLAQFASEFSHPRRGVFDRFMDGLNRLPRPMLALGTLGLFAAAMTDPVWFAQRMQWVALVPEPLWWLMGAIVSFYFGARHQSKSQEFQKGIADVLANTPLVASNIAALGQLKATVSGDEDANADNPALEEWRRKHGK